MNQTNEIKISVRNLVEFILRAGDLDTGFRGSSRAVEGTRAHQKIQDASDDNYTPEVHLKHTLEYEDFSFTIEGRADGVIIEDKKVTIDEIKSTKAPLEKIDEDYNPLHWAQAKCYGYIYCNDNELSNIDIRLTYYQIDTEEIKYLNKSFTYEELEEFFYDLIKDYLVWANFTKDWMITRNESINKLDFPFEKYREGQRNLAVATYRTISEKKRLFAQAPTGIGKTISTLFPSIKAIGEGYSSKIFYLTAKTITRQVAQDSTKLLISKNLRIKSLTITAKDKICFMEKSNCNPEYCKYAKGHFNRVNEAILDILNNEDLISRNEIEYYAKKHNVCPFEYSLDLAIWSDIVICDYNYAFDPRVYLKRFFLDNNGDYVFLIDEAHNLVDRSREMFSAELYKKPFLKLKKITKDSYGQISKYAGRINNLMLEMKKKCNDEGFYIHKESPDSLYHNLRNLAGELDEWLVKNDCNEDYDETLELYFEILAFTKIWEFYDEKYITYVEMVNKDVKVKLYCVDPSSLLGEAIKRAKAGIFFSATLTPLEYFKSILGGKEKDYIMNLPSPFDSDKLSLLISDNVSTKYRNRSSSYNTIVEYIKTVISEKSGNYLVFFPSYKYMNDVYEKFILDYPHIKTIIQSSGMTEGEREEFLNEFNDNTKETMVAFGVLGGIFSEGIDLTGERLLGAIIVGVGLPQICLERNIIRDYFNIENNMGYQYAYMFPGMNKVLQAAGRVIRTEDDRGVVLLIDERFNTRGYIKLFPKKWYNNKVVKSKVDISNNLNDFWKE